MIELIHTANASSPRPFAIIEGDTHLGKWCKEQQSLCTDPTVTQRLITILNAGDVVVDVGANIGDHTYEYAKRVGETGKVIAFEPYLPAFVALAVNVRGMRQVQCIHAALGESRHYTHLFPSENAGATHVALKDSVAPVRGDLFVNVITLDEYSLDRLHFLKLDVEGTEPEAIRGALYTIKKCRPVIFCEINHGALARYGNSADDIMRPLFDAGYRMEFLDPGHSLDLPQLDVFFVPQ